MGIVWEAYHKGVPLLGVPGIILDTGFWPWIICLVNCTLPRSHSERFRIRRKAWKGGCWKKHQRVSLEKSMDDIVFYDPFELWGKCSSCVSSSCAFAVGAGIFSSQDGGPIFPPRVGWCGLPSKTRPFLTALSRAVSWQHGPFSTLSFNGALYTPENWQLEGPKMMGLGKGNS